MVQAMNGSMLKLMENKPKVNGYGSMVAGITLIGREKWQLMAGMEIIAVISTTLIQMDIT